MVRFNSSLRHVSDSASVYFLEHVVTLANPDIMKIAVWNAVLTVLFIVSCGSSEEDLRVSFCE